MPTVCPIWQGACMALGIDGLLIETHPNPKVAKSDAEQQLDFDQFRALHASLKKVADVRQLGLYKDRYKSPS